MMSVTHKKESWLENFIGRRSISKTLQFELRPIGQTLKNIEKNGFLKDDEERASDFDKLKELIDEYHKDFIEKSLSKSQIDWTELKESLDKKKEATEDKDPFKDMAKNYRERIAKVFSGGENKSLFEKIFKKELLTEFLPKFMDNNNYSSKEKELVKKFQKFTTYLTGFQENRKNIYSSEEESTAIAYRLVHENFPKFVNNLDVFKKVQDNEPQIIQNAEKNLAKELREHQIDSLNKMFTLDYFNQTLTQSGIEFYNLIIGGRSGKGGTLKTQGLNELVNLYNQQHPQEKLPRFLPLYKQILSDKDSYSFRQEPFQNDNNLIEALQEFCENKLKIGTSESPLQKLAGLMSQLKDYNSEKMRVSNNNLSKISMELFGSWNSLKMIQKDYYETEKEKAACEKKKFFTFKELNEALKKKDQELKDDGEKGLEKTDILSFWDMAEIQRKIDDSYKELNSVLSALKDKKLNESTIEKIKTFLDVVLEFYHKIEILCDSEEERLLGEIEEPLEQLRDIIPLYNKSRNYVTRKPGDKLEKYKLTFGNQLLGGGWTKSGEKTKGCVIFLRDGNYYLGVLNNQDKPDLDKLPRTANVKDSYQKMVYQQVSDPTKDIPNLMVIGGKTVRKTGRKDTDGVNRVLNDLKNKHLPEEINRIRKSESYKQNSSGFNKPDLTKFIEYYMARIREYKSELSYDFKAPKEYDSYDEFLKDVKRQSYKITFESIAEGDLMKLVDEGKLFLFQIYNKDFSPYSKGKPNLHTIYWRMVFDPDNLRNTVIQLCGGAELFYRRGNGEKSITHSKGSILLNRQTKDGKTIPSDIYKELFDYFNKRKSESSLSKDGKEWLPKAVTKEAAYDIIKDKRFTEPKFKFHVPITINFEASDKDTTINKDILDLLREPDQDFTVLGIDRGERNLVYITLIDREGKILLQKSLNKVAYVHPDNVTTHYDYQSKLDQREKERDKSRKSWKTIGTIKELKEGYISQIVHEIAKIVVENNAVVVLEDLNFGFKRGRFHVEKQVYQKFEKAILDKLNYLVFKDRKAMDPGGALKGYQLTGEFKSFQKMKNQSGIVFYVPAAYTSKIDPTTGFTNFLGHIRYESVEKAKKLIRDNIRSIRFNRDENYFEFVIPEKKEKKGKAEKPPVTWTVCATGDTRWSSTKKDEKWTVDKVNVLQRLESFFNDKQISYKNGEELKESILQKQEKSFFEDFLFLLNLTLQLRYSNREAEGDRDRDYILSPVRNKDGGFFDSRSSDATLPQDADANGAYHIALKGLFHIKSDGVSIKNDFNRKWIEARRQELK